MAVEYDDFTVKKLKDLVRDRGISLGKSRPKKADLIAALRDDDEQEGISSTFCRSPIRQPRPTRTSTPTTPVFPVDLNYDEPDPDVTLHSQGTQCPSPDISPPHSPSPVPSRRPSMSNNAIPSLSHEKSRGFCGPILFIAGAIVAGYLGYERVILNRMPTLHNLHGAMAAAAYLGYERFILNRMPPFHNLHDYEFVPNQGVVNEEISTAIFNWNSRADEPDGALALHLAGGDMVQLTDIAKRIHYVVNSLPDSPGRGKYTLVNLNDDLRSCRASKNTRQCLEHQMASYLKDYSGCVVYSLDVSGVDFEADLTFLTAFTDDTAGYIPHSSGANLKVNKAALVLLSNFGADKFPKLTSSDTKQHDSLASDTWSKNKRAITNSEKGNWSDRFMHRLEAQIPVLSSKSGTVSEDL